MIYRFWALFGHATLATFFVWLLTPSLESWGDAFGQRLSFLPFGWAILLCAFVVFLALIPAIHLGSVRIMHIVSRRPPWLGSVVLAFLMLLLAEATSSGTSFNINTVELWMIVWNVFILGYLLALGYSFAIDRISESPLLRKDEDLPEGGEPFDWTNAPALIKWAEGSERHLESPSHDLFDRKPIVQRIVRRIDAATDTVPSFALVGAFGSGKTTVLHFIEDMLRHTTLNRQQISIVWIKSWGHNTGIGLATLILSESVKVIGTFTDPLEISTLPSHYRAAIDKSGSGFLSVVSAIMSVTRNAEDELLRLDSVLKASGRRLLIFIEDVDRSPEPRAGINDAQALLDRLRRKVKRVGFVLAIGANARHHFDFTKICDYDEILETLSPSIVHTALVNIYMELERWYPNDVNFEKPDAHAQVRTGKADSPYADLIPMELAELIGTPRTLRAVVRRVIQAWKVLHGEASLRDTLILHALKVQAPEAYEFILTRAADFRVAISGTQYDEEIISALKNDWLGALERIDLSMRRVIAACIGHLFPRWDAESNDARELSRPQSIAKGPSSGLRIWIGDTVDYLQRIVSEDVSGVRDQEVVKLAAEWAATQDTKGLPVRLLTDKLFSVRWERLCIAHRHENESGLSSDLRRILAEQLHAQVLLKDGRASSIEHTAIMALLRREVNGPHYGNNHRTQVVTEDWILQEIRRAIRVSLRFALSVEYYWANDEISIGIQKQVRQEFMGIMQEALDAGVRIRSVLDPLYPWTLHHLVRHAYEKAVFKLSDWKWLSPILIAELTACPDEMVAPMAFLFSKKIGKLWDRVVQIDLQVIGELGLTDDETATLLRVISSTNPTGLDENVSREYVAIQKHAEAMLQRSKE